MAVNTPAPAELPVISIVTPSYQQAEFIEDTIRSVISQRGDFELEYVVADGGSTDGTLAILKRYEDLLTSGEYRAACRKLSFRYLSEKDDGQGDAIHKGIGMTTGEYVAWLNSDDIYLHDSVLSEALAAFSEGADLVTADGHFVDRNGKFLAHHKVKQLNVKELIYLDYHILQPSTFFRRGLYQAEPLDRTLHYCLDPDLFIRMIRSGCQVKKVDAAWAGFRIYAEIKTLSGKGRRYKEMRAVLRRFSDNGFRNLVSDTLRYSDAVILPSVGKIWKPFHLVIRAASYLLLTGRPWR